MSKPGDETIRALREALKFSPDNVALRKHLAEVLSGYGRAAEAEKELREAIGAAPGDASLKVLLAPELRVHARERGGRGVRGHPEKPQQRDDPTGPRALRAGAAARGR